MPRAVHEQLEVVLRQPRDRPPGPTVEIHRHLDQVDGDLLAVGLGQRAGGDEENNGGYMGARHERLNG